MSKIVAAALVFVCSAAVLMLEILAGRLLAPYVGISLETYTSIIGTVLAGIALGAWGGGKLADRVDPRRLLGPTVALGGLLSLFTVPVVRSFGDQSSEGGRGATLFLAFAAFFLPAVVLSAVTPMVVKLQLHDLQRTGGVVGRLSGISTFGALVGTFVTGFLLVATTPTRTVIYAIGGTLMVIGIGLGLWLARRDSAIFVALAVLGGAAATMAASLELSLPGRERVLLHQGRARHPEAERAHPLARRPHAQLRRSRRPDVPRVRLRQVVQRRGRGGVARRARRWTRCTSAAEASRCRGISPPSIPAPRARCWRSTPRC